MKTKVQRDGLIAGLLVAIGVVGVSMRQLYECAWNDEFPGMVCTAGSSLSLFLGITGLAALAGRVWARRSGSDEQCFTFLGAVGGAALVYALVVSGF
ncbi:hypothetical protein B0G76_6318 [Paraburkholderia sp. BL23I1N1]|uniref:hypothetical protein n=1 Tax=Paraburkholderia sp. BL23I1N1 TaxID=1938802 RepID=UPI000E72621B|nr:hypothetical protein [Paraburkholderia sp. BL23I1N1]RKE39867.1 hypothetical protein B0G76_6318 [Paraburkholderia sp. BL23I1N1]